MMQPPQQSEPIDIQGAARLIAEAHEKLGGPDWFPAWLRRIARDMDRSGMGEMKGSA